MRLRSGDGMFKEKTEIIAEIIAPTASHPIKEGEISDIKQRLTIILILSLLIKLVQMSVINFILNTAVIIVVSIMVLELVIRLIHNWNRSVQGKAFLGMFSYLIAIFVFIFIISIFL